MYYNIIRCSENRENYISERMNKCVWGEGGGEREREREL